MNTGRIAASAFSEVKEVIESLGLQVTREQWSFGSMVTAVVKDGNRNLAQLAFSHNSNEDGHAPARISLLVHPVRGRTEAILAGEGWVDTDAKLDRVLDDVEGLFRTHLVMRKKLSYAHFPSDRVLRNWIASIGTKCGPQGDDPRMHAGSKASLKALSHVDALIEAYDRNRALALHRVIVDLAMDPLDRALWFMRGSARAISDVAYGRHALTWREGTHGAHLFATDKVKPPVREGSPDDPEIDTGFRM